MSLVSGLIAALGPFSTLATMAAALVTFLTGAIALGRSLTEYRLQGAQKRADLVLKRNADFMNNSVFARVRASLESLQQEPGVITFEEKRQFMTFLEEIALLSNTKLISKELTYYMFGYYAAITLHRYWFWQDFVDRERDWPVFMAFAREMDMRRKANNKPDMAAMKF